MRTIITTAFLISLIPTVVIAEDDNRQIAAPGIEPHAVTHEDVWLMSRLDKPELSPDGRWAVVSVTGPSYEEDADVSDLWLIATDGNTEPRQLTSTPEGEKSPTWSADGSKLAFVTQRGKGNDDEKDPLRTVHHDGSVLVDGRTPIDEINELLKVSISEEEEFDTVGGFVTAELGRIPKVLEDFVIHGLKCRIIEADARKITKLQLSRVDVGQESTQQAG